ncbi:CRISPR-associated protein Cas5 [Candidatus Desulforudis audaxviator]|uniref:CRISPR-associated protein Cas5 n=1 Tax=Candidatus Desulforudis audaxviator TaxID=471827 RepID=UPI0002DFFE6F|nr:CRISPR-associated protein Cas5 [Candidatus Desulforudis audaxviator]AZK60358.1 CRISPR-associated protein Cas5 [Candidatus Desulforudis audaxviator]
MNVLWVKVTAPLASFRRPLDHNYQRTLPLPPPTTLFGLAGAARGLAEEELWQEASPLRDLLVATLALQKPGLARDMWTVMKIKNNKLAERSPYFREILFNARFMILYGGPEELLAELQQAFLDPTYPLSLGREDELIVVEELGRGETCPGAPLFSGTVIPGDLQGLRFKWVPRPGIAFEPPAVETMPLAFEVDKRGIRYPLNPRPFTFLPYDLEVELEGYQDALTIEPLEGRSFTWMNWSSWESRTSLF